MDEQSGEFKFLTSEIFDEKPQNVLKFMSLAIQEVRVFNPYL